MSRLAKLGFIDSQRTSEPPRRRIRSRGVPAALADREVICTDDEAAAADVVSKFLGPARLHVDASAGETFQATMNAIRLRDVTMAYLDFHAPTTLDFAATGDLHYSVHLPTSGIAECLYDGGQTTAYSYQALVVNPRTRLSMHFAFDSPQLIIRIEKQALEDQLSRMLGRSLQRGEVRFSPTMNLTTGAAVRWHGAIGLLSSEAMTPQSLVQQGIGAGPIEELVISSLLWVQESNYTADLNASAAPGGRPAVRRSIRYIDQHLASSITLGDLAEHTNCSVRTIQQAFRDDLGTTPMNYVRDRRLERAKAELADSLPTDGVTVTQVAQKWGFSHLGHFSAAYRERFGESPSQTLRR